MKRFLICAECPEMGNLDLVVDANGVSQAVDLWQNYYVLSETKRPAWVYQLPPLSETPKALTWRQDARLMKS